MDGCYALLGAPVSSSRRRENESRSPLLVEGKDDEEEAIEMPIRKKDGNRKGNN